MPGAEDFIGMPEPVEGTFPIDSIDEKVGIPSFQGAPDPKRYDDIVGRSWQLAAEGDHDGARKLLLDNGLTPESETDGK